MIRLREQIHHSHARKGVTSRQQRSQIARQRSRIARHNREAPGFKPQQVPDIALVQSRTRWIGEDDLRRNWSEDRRWTPAMDAADSAR